MKDQTNLIIIIVSIVIAIGASAALFFTKREPIAPPAVAQPVLTPATVANAEPKMQMGLQASSGGASGFGGPSAGGPMGVSGPGAPNRSGPPPGMAGSGAAGGRPSVSAMSGGS